ncbi:MAG: glycyl-radical enzyme activating protein [Ruminococcaceae bacterium]|nr:glycyl-radical enzyme activating protein [Oscillospiraceae bacterium]
MTGRIFSIEEFATFDGPGIRMTVFLKGCPLRCSWCHNPESQRAEVEYVRSPNGCLSCGACLRAGERDARGALHLTAASVEACPRRLVRRCGEDLTVEALCARIRANGRILQSTGGGVTFSGGEPFAQFEFLRACLSALKGEVHTAIQTCGYTAPERFAEALTLCDYVLYDLKLMDPALHRRYCGTDNGRILENYRALAASGKEFVTRIPLIPGVTDTTENLSAIAAFVKEQGVDRVELLPYNRMAGSKYAGLLRPFEPGFDEDRVVELHLEIFEKHGIRAKKM